MSEPDRWSREHIRMHWIDFLTFDDLVDEIMNRFPDVLILVRRKDQQGHSGRTQGDWESLVQEMQQ